MPRYGLLSYLYTSWPSVKASPCSNISKCDDPPKRNPRSQCPRFSACSSPTPVVTQTCDSPATATLGWKCIRISRHYPGIHCWTTHCFHPCKMNVSVDCYVALLIYFSHSFINKVELHLYILACECLSLQQWCNCF